MDSVVMQLISAIKSRPLLYKIQSKTSKNKEILDRLWKEVACQMNYSEKDCKRKWNILRNCYARTLRYERSHKIVNKPWYLQNELSFLKNYINAHKLVKRNRVSENQSLESLDLTEDDLEQSYSIDIESSCSLPPVEHSNSSTMSIKSGSVRFSAPTEPIIEINKRKSPFIEEPHDNPNYVQKISEDEESNCSKISIKSSPIPTEEPAIEVQKQPSAVEPLTNNSNQLFLTSLLPDLNSLSERKQRIFKRMTIELLELLFEEDQYETTTQAHYQAPASNLDSAMSTVQVTAHHYDQPIVFTVTEKMNQ